MAIRTYKVDGRVVEVNDRKFDMFMQDYPDATGLDGKTPARDAYTQLVEFDRKKKVAEEVSQKLSQEEDTAIERVFGKNVVTDFMGDIYRAGKQGWLQGSSVDESFDVFTKGKDISEQDLKDFVEVQKELQKYGPSDEMREYERIKEEAGGGVWGFMKGMVQTRGQVIPQVIVSSMASLASTLIDSDEARKAAGATAAAGAAAGTAIPIPGIGTISGGIAGAFAGATGSLETAMTMTELLQDKLNEQGLEFNEENIRDLLENEEEFNKVKTNALNRGLAIGAVEGLTFGLSRGVGSKLISKGASAGKLARVTTGIEVTGGMGGEFAGQLAAGQDVDVAEILMEGIAEAKGVVNVADLIKKPKYTVNGEVRKNGRKEILKILDDVESGKLEARDIANIKMEAANDQSLEARIKKVLGDAELETQIDERVSGDDRKKLVDLENQKNQAEADVNKKGIFKKPGSQGRLDNLNAQIEEIMNKYEGVDITDTDVQARKKLAEDVRSIKLDATKKFAKVSGEQLGFDPFSSFKSNDDYVGTYVERAMANELANAKIDNDGNFLDADGNVITDERLEQMSNEFADDANNSDATIIDTPDGNKAIMINEEIAYKYGALDAGSHEVLHGVLRGSFAKMDDATKAPIINDFKAAIQKDLGANVVTQIENRLKTAYGMTDEQIGVSEEYFTALSDIINDKNNPITFEKNKGFFGSIKDKVASVFNKNTPYKQLTVSTGQDAYNFIKEYSKNVKEGKLSEAMVAFAEGKPQPATQPTAKPTAQPTAQPKAKPVEVYETTDADGTPVTVEVTTEADGTRDFVVKSQGKPTGENFALKPTSKKKTKDFIKTALGAKEAVTLKTKPADKPGKFSKTSPRAQEFLNLAKEGILTNESLVDVINAKQSSQEDKFAAVEAIIENNFPVISNSLKFNPTGDITIQTVKEAISEQMLGIFPKITLPNGQVVNREGKRLFDTYNKTKKVTTFLSATLGPRQAEIFTRAFNIGATNRGVSIDAKETRQIAGDAGQVTNLKDTRTRKINILQDFPATSRVANKIKSLVKVAEGDTFKQVISKYAGKVGELVFDIPAKKIMEGGANLIPTTKYKQGMPVPSEAQNIQKFFQAGDSMSKFIKSLPLYNVADKTADIDKIGENIDTPRSVFGVAIGLKGLPLDYFYENFTDPKGIITSPSGRSRGLTTQTQVKKLKSKFQKPTPETIEKVKQDIGITPKDQPNIYSRDIGQLQKGFAKVYSINAALSGGQRFLADKLAKAPVEKKPAIKKQIASVTAAQSKGVFSNSASRVEKVINVRSSLEIDDATFRDKLLEVNGFPPTIRVKTENDITTFIDNLKANIFPLLPKEAFFGPGKGTALTSSSKNLGMSSSNPLWAKFQERIQALKNDDTIVYGPPIPGVKAENIWSLRNKYTTLFSTPGRIRTNIENGQIAKFNKEVGAIHKALWTRINKAVRKDKTKTVASGIATYLGFVANDTGHWHKMGAQFAGYSKQLTKRKKGKSKVEYEHAMPATAAYLYLLDASINKENNFDTAYDLIVDNYKLIALDKAMDDKLRNARTQKGHSLMKRMPDDWSVVANNWYERYFNNIVSQQNGGIDPNSIVGLDGKTFAEKFNINSEGKSQFSKTGTDKFKTLDKAVLFSRSTQNETRGITVLDFDDTLATTKSLVKYTTPDGKTGTLNAEQFASTYENLQDEGYTFDFSDFNKVVKGKLAPLFNKAMKLQRKFGPENMFVLTARPPAAQKAIFDFLKANGLNIPLKNITGLGNSTSEAKALWVADKVAMGYNDFYFADDALQNVQAVKNMLDQFDVKSKVQQARVNFSKSMSKEFNNILQDVVGVDSEQVFSKAQAKLRGKKTKYQSIIPPSAQDFMGLLYNFVGKGTKGEKQIAFLKKALVDPFAKGIKDLNSAKQNTASQYEILLKQFPKVKKKLKKKVMQFYTNDHAVRVYLFNKAGFEIPGMSQKDVNALDSIVKGDPELQAFAETLGAISKKDEGYYAPGEHWIAESITSDVLSDGSLGEARSVYLTEFLENKNQIFSEQNLNKIEAVYGSKFREALTDILYRMESGRSRPAGGGRLMNMYMNWTNNSVGAIMFFNMRSAVLQTISAINYINWSDNNPLKAAAAFGNQKQYWKDFSMIFNSDFLKQRRAGNQRGINEAELSAAVAGSSNKAKAALAWLLRKGFLPTQIADSFAIASGGATFYRNRVKALMKQTNPNTDEKYTAKEAEERAFLDLQETTEESQQSARPDMLSQQQASPLGRLILSFQNTPMQYARIMNKAARDIINGRGDLKTNVSKIVYYGAIQGIIFGALQQAIFASLGEDEEEDFGRKKERILNQMFDSVLSGIGFGGKAVSTLKNTTLEFLKQKDKGYNADHAYTILQALSFSPPIGSKLRKIYSAIQTDKYNEGVFTERGFTLDNPIWNVIGNVIEGTTNIPLGRLSNKLLNIDNALDSSNETYKRIALLLGWNTWDLGIRDKDIEGVKKKVKKQNKEEKKKEKEEQEKKQEEENKKKDDGRCAAISGSGERCKNDALPGKSFCSIHEEVEQRKDGKEVQCKKIKNNGKRCKMKTSNKSGLCYHHD